VAVTVPVPVLLPGAAQRKKLGEGDVGNMTHDKPRARVNVFLCTQCISHQPCLAWHGADGTNKLNALKRNVLTGTRQIAKRSYICTTSSTEGWHRRAMEFHPPKYIHTYCYVYKYYFFIFLHKRPMYEVTRNLGDKVFITSTGRLD
jgi:hypothetical protein